MENQYIGIDLHSDKFTCCFSGTEKRTITYQLDESYLNLFYEEVRKKDTHIIFEASTNSFEFYDRLKEKVKSMHIVNPNKMKIISQTSKKTDKVDARKLMKLLKYREESGDRDFLPEVYVPDEDIREIRSLFTSYKLYKKNIAQQKNRIHSLLKQSLQGKKYKGREITSKRTKEEILKDEDIKDIYKTQIKLIYKSIDMLNKSVNEIKEHILWKGKKYKEEIKILTTIPGISVFIAIGIKSDYADIRRFKNAKHFTSYLRSVPRIDSSNAREYIGKTKKDGRKLSISLITQSLYHITRQVSPIRDFYKRKQYGKSKGKVRMAVVRKILVTMYYMLKREKGYIYTDERMSSYKMKEYERFLERYEKN